MAHTFGSLVLLATTTALVSCGGADDDPGEPSAGPASTATATPIMIMTQIEGFTGQVLDGSVLAGEPFCTGGTVQHEHGSPAIGFPAVNVFSCAEGELQIAFGPGPGQMNNATQTSDWKVIEGSGAFEGATGNGHMSVTFESVGSIKGAETFEGTVTLP